MTYQHVLCLSTMRRKDGSPYPQQDPLPEFVTDIAVPKIEAVVHGEQQGVIEVHTPPLPCLSLWHLRGREADCLPAKTYTVEFSRDNAPLRAYVVGRLKSSNARFVANHGSAQTLSHLASFQGGEKIGLSGVVHNDGTRNLFTLTDTKGKL